MERYPKDHPLPASESSEHAFDITRGEWRVTGDYDGESNIVFYFKGDLFRQLTCPSYKIWNVPAHLTDIIADFEAGLAAAMWTGLPNG